MIWIPRTPLRTGLNFLQGGFFMRSIVVPDSLVEWSMIRLLDKWMHVSLGGLLEQLPNLIPHMAAATVIVHGELVLILLWSRFTCCSPRCELRCLPKPRPNKRRNSRVVLFFSAGFLILASVQESAQLNSFIVGMWPLKLFCVLSQGQDDC